MRLLDLTKFYNLIREDLGDDLVISLAYDNDEYYLAISVHKSKTWRYDHGRNVQSCLLTQEDMEKDINVLVDDIVRLYRTHMVEIDESN